MVEDSPDDGNFLVRVRAQVMTRDDSTGGWVPMGGGGLSNVSVRKRIISEDERKPEYVICGKRISDQSIVLSCTIKKDFQYNKVMPTFHHWITGDKKFGLTFQTAADARAFDKGVRTAVEDSLEGIGCVHKTRESDDLGDDDVFMTLDLPVESRSSTGSSSESGNGAPRPTSTTSSIPGDTPSATSSPHTHHHHLHRIHFMKPSRTMPPSGCPATATLASSASATELLQKEEAAAEPYVQFSAHREHDYCYPALETLKRSPKPPAPPLLPSKGPQRRQGASPLRCRLCLDAYAEAENRPGACRFGRDRTLRCIEWATFLPCARCMLYHCAADADGDFRRCGARRWTGLALLSVLVPCLWCYLPLRACHRCGVGCGYCGGRHESE